ncbi:nucleoside hydrolase [Dictyobacter vulcani]|uniref:Nucleoside hydrolase n=1 Tax=Dictyobacter vulcani TaxID=2607529 RepID=A0A5J4KVA5_9CHLR|nr:nucleoside hydrolase [Dictyobacter vulcani]GER90381.1 nucleoside hydrolase [Dictyobacter vulcani]
MHRLLIDTDPGIDDALALFLAVASPEVQIEGITTVSGNVPITMTTRNALALLELAGKTDLTVASGSNRPLLRQPVFAGHVHGGNGLGGLQLPEPQQEPLHNQAVTTIIQKILQAPGEITLIALGPLTNLALAVRCEPQIAQMVREVVIMGGALRVPGNVTPNAEFNIYADPHAAQIVMHAGWPIRLVSLDVTNQTRMDRTQFATLAASNHPVTNCIQSMATAYINDFGKQRGISGLAMHDPLCLAAAIQPDLISWKKAYVDIELNGLHTQGHTIAYFEQPESLDTTLIDAKQPNVLASMDVDQERFLAMYMQTITAYYSAH